MTTHQKLVTSGIFGAALTVAGPAQAASVDATLAPFLLKYEACAYFNGETRAEIRSRCASVRTQLIADIQPVVKKFFPLRRTDAEQRFTRALIDIERAAEWVGKNEPRVGTEEMQYQICFVDHALADPPYLSGRYLSGRTIENACNSSYDAAIAAQPSNDDGAKVKKRLAQLRSYLRSLHILPEADEGLAPSLQ